MPVQQQLIEFAKSVLPAGGISGPYALADVLDADPEALVRFKNLFESVRAEDLDGLESPDFDYGTLVMAAADALDLLPDDPRLFKSEAECAALPASAVLGALCSACIVNDVKTVERLAVRTDVNALDHNKQTALCYAAGNNHAECVRILLERGADPNRVQNLGNTPMHIAAGAHSREPFEMLRRAGGDLTIANDEGDTPLDLLDRYGRRSWAEA